MNILNTPLIPDITILYIEYTETDLREVSSVASTVGAPFEWFLKFADKVRTNAY